MDPPLPFTQRSSPFRIICHHLTVTEWITDFFEGSAKDLVELALNLAGQGGEPKEITLRGTPTVDTPIGPIRYPQPITIASQRVGS